MIIKSDILLSLVSSLSPGKDIQIIYSVDMIIKVGVPNYRRSGERSLHKQVREGKSGCTKVICMYA